VTAYLDRLAERSAKVSSCLCLGIDPDPATLPTGFVAGIAGIARFAELLLDAAAPYAAAVKANLAFFEAYGSDGIAALERLRSRIPEDVPFIADAKRGDIGSTAARQAVALFDILGADAVTASPYLGRDALAPFLDRPDRFTYVLCRTSNSGAAELQNVTTAAGKPLYLAVAQMVASWASEAPTAGLVVGATAPNELTRVRDVAPQLPFLVPGVGAQGGDLATTLEFGPTIEEHGRRRGGSLLVNVSRGIAGAASGSASANGSLEKAVAAAAADWSARLRC